MRFILGPNPTRSKRGNLYRIAEARSAISRLNATDKYGLLDAWAPIRPAERENA